MDLPGFLLARIAEDEEAARMASMARNGNGGTLTGEHWRWEDNDEQAVALDIGFEYVSGATPFYLVSTEEYPTQHVGPLAHLVLSPGNGLDLQSGAAAHIARHDPAHVLAWCAVLRAIVELHRGSHECPSAEDNCGWVVGGDCETLRLLAAVWADHPAFNPAWRV